ncbi:acetyl-CoA acetyltransferase family protein [Paraburkholderia sp. WC7.3d]
MTDAVIVSTARTGLAKSWRGGFNMTHGATLGGHVTQAAVERAKLDPARIEDVIMGCANPEGATGGNIARQIALRAGLPVSVPGMTVNRFCSSGLQTIALASQRVIAGEGDVYVAGGVESISCVQNEMNHHMMTDGWLTEHKPEIYWSMLQTAENVAKRYSISKERQDEYGVRSQQRAHAALEAGRFNDEIVPLTVLAGVADKATGPSLYEGSDRQRRRRHSRRHDARRRVEDSHRPAGRRDYRGQCEPVFGRRIRLRRDERDAGRTRRAAAARHFPRLCGGRLRTR